MSDATDPGSEDRKQLESGFPEIASTPVIALMSESPVGVGRGIPDTAAKPTNPESGEKRTEQSKRKIYGPSAFAEVAFGLILCGCWALLFVTGSTIAPEDYRGVLRDLNPKMEYLEIIGAAVGVSMSFTPINACAIAIVSALIGCFGRRMSPDRDSNFFSEHRKPDAEVLAATQYGFAVMSGFVLYLAFLGGVMIMTSDQSSSLLHDDGSTSQYVRFAGLISVFATYFGYFPNHMKKLFDKIENVIPFGAKDETLVPKSGQTAIPTTPSPN